MNWFKTIILLCFFQQPILAQQLGLGGKFALTDHKYDMAAGGEIFMSFYLDPKFCLQPSIASTYFFYNSTTTVGETGGAIFTTEESGGRTAFTIGCSAFYSPLGNDKSFEVLVGPGVRAYLFGQPNGFVSVQPFFRFGIELPVLFKFNKVGGSRIGLFLGITPSAILKSSEGTASRSDIGEEMIITSIKTGLTVDLEKSN